MSTTNTAKLHLVSRSNLANILREGFSKQTKQDISDSEKVYLNVREEQEDIGKPISPEKVSVVVLRNKETKKLSTSPQKIEDTLSLMRDGIESSEYEMKAMPLNQYMDKMRAMQLQEFQKKIQGRDNYHLGDVALLISMANKNNDKELLTQMVDLIKFDPNYQFAFDGGKLDLNKLYDMSRMDRSKVEAGMDIAEEIEDRGGNVDSTEIEADEIAEYSEKTEAEIEQTIEQDLQEQGNDEIDEEKTASRINQIVARMAKGLAKGVAVGILARVARMNIKDKIKEKTEASKQKNPRVQAKEGKTKEALSKDDNGFNPYRENQDNGNRETAKKEQNSREIESRQQREKLEKEVAIKRIEEKINDGKELNKDEQDLYQAHLNETAKQKENVLGNSLMAYALQDNKDFQRRTNEVMEKAKETANEKETEQLETTLEQDAMEL